GRHRQTAGDERVHRAHHMVREQQADDVLGGPEGVVAPADRFPEDTLLKRLAAPRPHEPGSDGVLLIELHGAQVFGRHRIGRAGDSTANAERGHLLACRSPGVVVWRLRATEYAPAAKDTAPRSGGRGGCPARGRMSDAGGRGHTGAPGGGGGGGGEGGEGGG